jgi:hypothetical protein
MSSPLPSPPYLSPSICIDSVPRLSSPIQLQPTLVRVKSVSKLRSSANPRTPSPRDTAFSQQQQSQSQYQHHQRRRRHCQGDCYFETVGASNFFDSLPWISAMETTKQPNYRDIADLSQLDVLPSRSGSLPSGPGPVRRRKTSSRSNPLTAAPLNEVTPNHVLLSSHLSIPSPFRGRLLASSPRTPLSRFSLSRVRFNDLLPVFSPDCEPIRHVFDTD